MRVPAVSFRAQMNMTKFRWLVLGAMTTVGAVSPALAEGDSTRGEMLYQSRCVACHSLDANRVGPAHQGVYGRKAGGAIGYDYSTAVKVSTLVWTEVTLDRWLADPELTIPGQKMGYSVPSPGDRADLIAYLKQASGK
jgi:cytochrome c